jgi:uncharacterized protein involved in exopolysaccharide biosynthesis
MSAEANSPPLGEGSLSQPAGPPLPAGYCPDTAYDDEEVHLLDLFIVLLRHKVLIFLFVFLTGSVAAAVSLWLPDIYQSAATIVPTTQERGGGALSALGGFGAMIAGEAGIVTAGSIEQFDVVLKSRELTASIVRRYNLQPYLFAERWDPTRKAWREEAPKFEQIHGAMQNRLTVRKDKNQNVVNLSFEAQEPEMARKILNYYIDGLSDFLRNQILTDAAAQQRHLGEQIAKTSDPLLRNRLYELIAKQIEQETLARVQRYYSFNVIDPPYVPERKFKPKRTLICVLSVVVALFLAIFLAFFLEYVRNLRTREDPARLESLRAAFRFRRKRR